LIAPQGLSVISDIDDTIKLSHVTDKSELIKNTFLREFRDVEGMADIYTGLSKRGVAFHYVSGSVWQLYQPIAGFFSEAGFPRGTFHLKHFRLKDRSVTQLWSSQTEHKLNAINPIIADFPNRHLVLIGDSGEQDPEIYGEIARQYPDQIVGIFIRNATDESPDDERFEKAFRKIANNRWMLFDEANEIQASLDKLASEHASAQ
jgi:phosphatidate phosphatase APP1